MSERSFFDTNILLYTDDHDSPAKQKVAIDLYEMKRTDRQAVVSTQVLQEYYVGATRKLRVPPRVARAKVEILARAEVVRIDSEDILAAIDLTQLHRFSFWDALVFRAARRANCRVLFTEDLQHGFKLDGVRVLNPFAGHRTS